MITMSEETKVTVENLEDQVQTAPQDTVQEDAGLEKPGKEKIEADSADNSDSSKKPGEQGDQVKSEDEPKDESKDESEDTLIKETIDDLAEIAQDAMDAAEKAADQMGKTAKSAYSRTSKAAKSAAESAVKAARNAGAQAAANAEENQARFEAEAAKEPDNKPVRDWHKVLADLWSKYLESHSAVLIYGLVGFLSGVGILKFGFWPVALVLACTYIGVLYGRYRDGDPRLVDFLKRQFEDDDE